MSSKKHTVLGVDMSYKQVTNDTDRILAAAKKHSEETERKKSFPLRPSAALKSDLDLYYDLVNYYNPGTIAKDEMDGRVHILLASGHFLEDFVVEQINRVHEVVATNERVMYGEIDGPEGKIPLKGEYDLIFKDCDTGELILGDSKTSSDYAFRRGLPKEEHFAQLNLYMHSDEFKQKGITKARLYYYNKNNSDYDTYEFEYSEQLALNTLKKFQNIMDMYINKTPPTQEYYWGHHWKAAYGSYRTVLHDKYNAAKSDRPLIDVNRDVFERYTNGPKAELIKKYAEKFGTAVIVNGKSNAFLNLTQKGLVVRVMDKSGFTSL